MRKAFVASLLAVILLGTLALTQSPVARAAAPTCTGTIQPPQQIVLTCTPGFATERDSITVIVRDGVKTEADWQSQLDYTNSVWIFDAGSRGRASLIIDFHRQDAALVADLYDDGNNDGLVLYQYENNLVRILENNSRPTVKVTAKDGWWQKDGLTNFNLDILIDGPLRGNHNSGFAYEYAKILKTDGKNDYEIYVRDPNHNGRPDYEYRQDRSPLPEDPKLSGQYRTEIDGNTSDSEVPLSGSLFWPYLNYGEAPYNKLYNQSPAPIQMDWAKSKLTQISEFVASRGGASNYFIYSINRVHEGQTNTTVFENPFAFYDLAGANDGWPDTAIRFENNLPGERLANGIISPTPISIIEYAWGREHNHSLNYQVSVTGRRPITETITYPEFAVKAVPPQSLPTYVTGQKWDAATFVEVEKQPYWTAEVVYEYNVEQRSPGGYEKVLPWGYVTGKDSQPPTAAFDTIQKGFRGEYSFDLNAQPYLYFSPIDRKLHLLKAGGGIWQMTDTASLKYGNVAQQNYVDQWTYQSVITPSNATLPITSTRQLNAAPGHLLYSGEDEVIIRRAEVSPSVFESLPPANQAEWQNLNAKLAAYPAPADPTDLKAMLRQFNGSEVAIKGASMRDYRREANGDFRFVLRLLPFYDTQKTDWLNLTNLDAGEYVVTYHDGGFKVTPLTPVQPEITNLTVLANSNRKTGLSPQTVTVEVENKGLEDGLNLPIGLTVTSATGQSKVLTATLTTLPGGAKSQVNISWIPSAPGNWTLSASMPGVAPRSLKISIDSGTPVDPGWSWQDLSGAAVGLAALLVFLVGFGGLFGLYFYRQIAPGDNEPDADADTSQDENLDQASQERVRDVVSSQR